MIWNGSAYLSSKENQFPSIFVSKRRRTFRWIIMLFRIRSKRGRAQVHRLLLRPEMQKLLSNAWAFLCQVTGRNIAKRRIQWSKLFPPAEEVEKELCKAMWRSCWYFLWKILSKLKPTSFSKSKKCGKIYCTLYVKFWSLKNKRSNLHFQPFAVSAT